MYGELYGAVVVPLSWGTHAAAEFGKPPQVILNKQLVDRCDICIAIFANRLGTPSAVAESGTAEEIKRLSEQGKYVGILRSRRPVDASALDADQVGRLQEYLKRISPNSLVLQYSNDSELSDYVDNILVSAVSRDQERTEMQLQFADQTNDTRVIAEVWPRLESEEFTRTASRGRVAPSRRWFLSLNNMGSDVARDVTFRLIAESGDPPRPQDLAEVERLAPGGEVRFALVAHMGTARQFQCRVEWQDNRGQQTNEATLRLS
jgi:hypothetical protein